MKKRILIINTIGLGYEGITSVIRNYMANMNCEGISFSFVAFSSTPKELIKEFKRYGEVFFLPKRKENLQKYINSLKEVLNRCDAVHIHGNSGTMAIEAFLAKKCNVKQIIVHCHNTTCNHPIINQVLKIPMKKIATDLLACSKESGKWLYGRSQYIVLNNAINTQKYAFNSMIREKYRQKLGVEKEYLIGHIGHFTEQKNHEFLIDVFNIFHQKEPESKLLLLSDGPKFQLIKEKVHRLGLDESVLFLGRRNDVHNFYQAMDMFILPSRWEGLPVVMLEAQASGVPILASDCITDECVCTECVFFESIYQSADVWANKIYEIKKKKFDREEPVSQLLRKNGFDISAETEKLRMIYCMEK